MKPVIILCLALVLSGGFSVTIARAQPGGDPIYTSLEARILQARVVFRGTITNLSDSINHTNRPNLHYSQEGVITNKPVEYDIHNYTFTLTVDEVLKGNIPRQPLEFTVNQVSRWHELEISAAEHGSFLWFVDGSEKTIGTDFFAGLNPPNFVFLGPPLVWPKDEGGFDMLPQIYDMDMSLLTDPQAILARARAFASKRMAAATFHKIYLPEESSSDHYFSSSYLVVPVEPSLEKIAGHLLAAPEDFISKTNEPALVPQWRCDLRAEGVNALQYFKSAKNITLLKSLLDAPDFWMKNDWSTKYRDMKKYSVRSKSYEVLTGWGVDVSKPVTEETVPANKAKP